METQRILVVDDDLVYGESIKSILNIKGFEAVFVGNPQDAFVFLRKKQYSIALIDLYLPHINGIDLAREIMSHQPSITTVIMTGAGTVDDYLRSRSAGVSEFINKPIDISALVRMIERINIKG